MSKSKNKAISEFFRETVKKTHQTLKDRYGEDYWKRMAQKRWSGHQKKKKKGEDAIKLG